MTGAIIPVTPFEQNCLLLWDRTTTRGAVIDPGGDVPRILDGIEQSGMQPELILLTHGHLDHAGGAAELQRELRRRAARPDDTHMVPIVGPDRRDAFLLNGIAEQARQYGLEGMNNARPDRWLQDGDTVAIGGHSFTVRHCPGHTPGHIVFIANDSPLAIVGDVLFQGSVGRTDFPYGDHTALLAAIRDTLLPLDDGVQFLCGHGPGSTIGAERRTNPFIRGL
ncbi:MAG: MBL fold metallo-hydrolase [Acetobacteraceae bacterium]|nr:MBL fold metallo-hydrolase [Acetobacteraceae bacterium]